MNKSLLLFTTLLVLAGAGCQKPAATTQNAPFRHTYDVRGIVRGINYPDHNLVVEHEDVPGFMPSMTMPFDYRSPLEVETIATGDAIAFQLIVTDRESWIEKVKHIDGSNLKFAVTKLQPATHSKVERLKEGDRLPEFELTDDHSARITRATFAGKPLLLTFIFTRCPIPNFCPLMSRNFADIRKDLASSPTSNAEGMQYLSISFDTEFDTPERLANYADHIAPNRAGWRFASGTPAEIEKLTKAFSVYIQSEGGTFSHGLCTALVSPDGTIRKIWRGNSWEPSEALTAMRAMAQETALANNSR
jgi:protein SCO1/2